MQDQFQNMPQQRLELIPHNMMADMSVTQPLPQWANTMAQEQTAIKQHPAAANYVTKKSKTSRKTEQTHRQTHTQTDRQNRQTDRQIHTHTNTHARTNTDRHTRTYTHTDDRTHTHTQRER